MQKTIQDIPLNQIYARENTRKNFNENKLKELALSIKNNGVLQPICVRKTERGFEIVFGERRFRASEIAGKVTIPAEVIDADEVQVLKIQIVENLQRQNISVMEECRAIGRMREELNYDNKEIGRTIGKSESYVSFQISLMKSVEELQIALENKWITRAVAIRIAALSDPELQKQATRDLQRTNIARVVTIRNAEDYLRERFGAQKHKSYKPVNGGGKLFTSTNGYRQNWKHYLVRFSNEQFAEFRTIVHGRTDVETLSEAVECVMCETNSPEVSSE